MPLDTVGPASRVESQPNAVKLELPGRVGVIGAGAFGRFCIGAYGRTPDLRVLAAADPDASALGQLENLGLRLHQDWRRVLEDQEIEVVHLAAPPYVRRDVVFASLEAGKSVFCEKP